MQHREKGRGSTLDMMTVQLGAAKQLVSKAVITTQQHVVVAVSGRWSAPVEEPRLWALNPQPRGNDIITSI